MNPSQSKPQFPGVSATHAFVDRLAAHAAQGHRPLTCKAGCYHCCHEPVHAEKSEVLALIASVPDQDLPDLMLRVNAWWKRFHEHGLQEMQEHPAEGDFGPLLKYRAAQLWCPLLDRKTGLCSVYASRPMNCRLHAATGPEHRCKNDAQRHKQMFAQFDNPDDLAQRTMSLMCNNAPRSILEWDHLGVWLGKLMLGATTQTATAHSYIVDLTDPS